MPKPYAHNIWTKDRWKTERDDKKHKVPSGAVSGVKMGDTLKKFHEEHAKGLIQGLAAAKTLKAAITKYQTGIKAKYKVFHDRIQQRLEADVNDYIGAVARIVVNVPKYTAMRKQAWDEIVEASQALHTWKTLGGTGEFKYKNGSGLEQAVVEFQSVADDAMFCTDKIKEDDRRNFEIYVKRVQSKKWDAVAIENLFDKIAKIPASI
jgi:hypothetical protein